jgi:hypothetical protein
LVTCLYKAREEKTSGADASDTEIHSLESKAEALPPEGIGQMLHHGEMSEYTSPSKDASLVRLMRGKAAL